MKYIILGFFFIQFFLSFIHVELFRIRLGCLGFQDVSWPFGCYLKVIHIIPTAPFMHVRPSARLQIVPLCIMNRPAKAPSILSRSLRYLVGLNVKVFGWALI